jgi:hypothetical protein
MTTRTPRTTPAKRPPEHAERVPRKRASKRRLRALAWIAGGLAFAAPFTALASSPKPVTTQRANGSKAPVTIVRRITKRVVITHPAAQAPVQYVAPSGSSSSSSSSSSGGTIAAPAPTTSTSGS